MAARDDPPLPPPIGARATSGQAWPLYPPAAVAPLARSICNNIYQYISLIYGPSYQNQTKQRAREEREQADVVAGSPIGRAELGNRRPFGLPSRCARCSSSLSLSLSLPLPRNISLPRARARSLDGLSSDLSHGELLSQPHAPQSFARRAWRPGRRCQCEPRLSTMPRSQGALRRRVAMLALQEDRLRVLRSCLTSRRPASPFHQDPTSRRSSQEPPPQPQPPSLASRYLSPSLTPSLSLPWFVLVLVLVRFGWVWLVHLAKMISKPCL